MRAEKESIRDELKQKVDGAVFIILTDYRGMSVAQSNDLRVRLSEAEARYQVVQNRMLGFALADVGGPGLEEGLRGPSAMVYGRGDMVRVAKVLREFVKEHKLPVVKIGSLEGTVLSSQDIEQLAALPSREQLLANVVGALAAPLRSLAGVFHQKVSSLLYALKAIEEKKQAA